MRRVLVLGIAISALVGACADRSVQVAAPNITPTNLTDQFVSANSTVCPLLESLDVQHAFGLSLPLQRVAMAEAHGPACGYPNLDGRGYLLVVQFQPAATWTERSATGTSVEGLGNEAMYQPPEKLFVHDHQRSVVVMFLAMGNPQALLRVAAIAYDKSPNSVRLAS